MTVAQPSAAAPTASRPAGREHIPLFPKNWIVIRIVQLVLCVIILGLSGYGVAIIPVSGPVFVLVVALFTLITSIYHIVAEFAAPQLYNYWAILGLDIFLVVMWLASFALLASQVAFVFGYYDLTTAEYVLASCLAAASGLGAVEFVLHIATLSVHGVRLHQHRAAGLHCMPGEPASEKPVVVQQQQQQQQYVYQQAPAPQQQQPQQQPYGAVPQQPQYYAPQPGQAPISIQTTGGSYQQAQPQYYQQGPAVPLFPQATGGSSIQQQQPMQPPQQQQPVQPMQPELPNNQIQSSQQQY